MSTSEKIAHAYGVLVARGDKVTVRAVQKQAGVRIGEVAAWMREHATGAAGEVPEAPDLSEPMSAMVASVWAAAWKRAAEQADEATAVALDAARAGEADALAAAETATAQQADADAARDEAVRDAEQLRTSWPRSASNSRRCSVRQSRRASRPRRLTVPGCGPRPLRTPCVNCWTRFVPPGRPTRTSSDPHRDGLVVSDRASTLTKQDRQ
ncbi:hypothetical protein [Dietzia cercidiphylli]|uniref:hypothetical protein n=1 Tax=Dietzia cercidiphylli TaxID=498199 RepID=UPI00223BB88C|nr:hypothetical protein [Dietzia cercidiphylli]MCT1514834.1 hypothetical protein [Dietzia cercidiphylli]